MSFEYEKRIELNKSLFAVCEKTDGFRYFFVETLDGTCYLVDREFAFRRVSAEVPKNVSKQVTIISMFDGELVQDKGLLHPTYLISDCLVFDGRIVMQEPNYFNRLNQCLVHFIQPLRKQQSLRGVTSQKNSLLPSMSSFPVILMLKDIFKEQDTEKLFDFVLSKLPHENDGLIFTKEICPYYPETTEDILKWKPKHLNTIDFEAKSVDFLLRLLL